jgi:hypothetical protein
MRTIIVYLAIAALLVCPYDCAAKFAAAQADGSKVSTSCCKNCRARELSECPELSGPRSTEDCDPAQRDPSGDGKSCLCEGAVFDAATRLPADAVLEFSLLSWVADLAARPFVAAFTPSLDRADSPPIEVGGRQTRIAIRSLLV